MTSVIFTPAALAQSMAMVADELATGVVITNQGVQLVNSLDGDDIAPIEAERTFVTHGVGSEWTIRIGVYEGRQETDAFPIVDLDLVILLVLGVALIITIVFLLRAQSLVPLRAVRVLPRLCQWQGEALPHRALSPSRHLRLVRPPPRWARSSCTCRPPMAQQAWCCRTLSTPSPQQMRHSRACLLADFRASLQQPLPLSPLPTMRMPHALIMMGAGIETARSRRGCWTRRCELRGRGVRRCGEQQQVGAGR